MTFTLVPEEIQQAVKQFTSKDVKVSFIKNQILIQVGISIITATACIVPSANGYLSFEVDRVVVAGINVTALARNQIFKIVQKYSNNLFSFSLVNRSICFHLEKIVFSKVTADSQLSIDFQVQT